MSFHPSGNEILVGFDDNVKVYHVLSSEMKQAHQINVKCMIHVYKKDSEGMIQDKLIMNQDSISSVQYDPTGGKFAVVTGKFVQVFDTYGSGGNGQPTRVTMLSGHAQVITALAWTADGSGLFTTDCGGAVYEWKASNPDRIRETLISRVNISAVCTSYNGGVVIATGGGKKEKFKEEVQERQRKKEKELAFAGRTTMFNPQHRIAIQESRKRSVMQKKKMAAMKKARTLGKMNIALQNQKTKKQALIGGYPEGKRATAEGGRVMHAGAAGLMGWYPNIEGSASTQDQLPNRVTRILATARNDFDVSKRNFAFALDGKGGVCTFAWGEICGPGGEGKGVKRPVSMHCQPLSLHHGEAIDGFITKDDRWLFTAGKDGCIVMSSIEKGAEGGLKVVSDPLNVQDEEVSGGRGAKRRPDYGSVGNKNYTYSYLRTRRACSDTIALILIPHPNNTFWRFSSLIAACAGGPKVGGGEQGEDKGGGGEENRGGNSLGDRYEDDEEREGQGY